MSFQAILKSNIAYPWPHETPLKRFECVYNNKENVKMIRSWCVVVCRGLFGQDNVTEPTILGGKNYKSFFGSERLKEALTNIWRHGDGATSLLSASHRWTGKSGNTEALTFTLQRLLELDGHLARDGLSWAVHGLGFVKRDLKLLKFPHLLLSRALARLRSPVRTAKLLLLLLLLLFFFLLASSWLLWQRFVTRGRTRAARGEEMATTKYYSC